MDFTALLMAIDATPTIYAITSVAAVLIAPAALLWSFNKVIAWFDDRLQIGMSDSTSIEEDYQTAFDSGDDSLIDDPDYHEWLNTQYPSGNDNDDETFKNDSDSEEYEE